MERPVVMITGAAVGFGRGLARVFARCGFDLALVDKRPEITDTVEVTEGFGATVHSTQGDVTDDDVLRDFVDTTLDRFGRIDILINNAGIGAQGSVADNDDAEWVNVFDVNVFGIVRVTRAALPYLERSAHAAIVNTGSIAGWAGLPQRAAYCATKGAVHALTLAMAADHVRDGIRVNAVAPGTADTPWIGRLLAKADDPSAERTALEARQPIGRLVSADEVATAICYLASPLAGSTTGTILAVDGGMHGLRLRPAT